MIKIWIREKVIIDKQKNRTKLRSLSINGDESKGLTFSFGLTYSGLVKRLKAGQILVKIQDI